MSTPYHLHVTIQEPTGTPEHAAPLLFVHGTGQGAWCWEEHFLPFFAAHGYRAAALDLRGHGASAGRADLMRFRLADYVADVVQVAGDLAAQTGHASVLLGHSLGGAVVQRIVDDDLMPLAAAVLLAPIPRGKGWQISSGAAMKAFGVVRLMRMVIGKNNALMYETPAVMHRAFFAKDMPRATVESYWRRFQPESWMRGDVGRFAATLPQPHPALPLLVVAGAEDATFPPRAQEITAGYYQADLRVIPGVGHEMMLDQHWQDAAQVVLDWLRPHPPAPSPSLMERG
jgi:pimeloyl-ACP methyl ester carboxylesterase